MRLANHTAPSGWRAESARRIEVHRKADFTLQINDTEGAPLVGAPVEVRLTRHAFLFGTCVNTALLHQNDENADQYRAHILHHFTGLVDEGSMKWQSIEKEQGHIDFSGADTLLEFAEKHGLPLRGHCLHWSKEKFARPWVKNLDDETLRAHALAHVDRMVAHTRGRVICWDAYNEMLDGTYFQDRLGPNFRAEVLQRAHAVDPDVPLFVNEYHIIDSDERVDQYLCLIRGLQAQGAPIHGIGVQAHAAERFAHRLDGEAPDLHPERAAPGDWHPLGVWRRLDALAATGLPIHFTEISAKSKCPEHRADGLEIFLRTAFAHPRVEAILLWGFWEHAHWLGEAAALVAADWTMLEPGRRVLDLWEKEWTTRETLLTDCGGRVRFRGFPGDYEVLTPVGAARAHLDKEPGNIVMIGITTEDLPKSPISDS